MSITSPPCAMRGRGASGPGAGGACRDRGRRRRHHRASARGPPPYPRRRHGAAEGRDLKTAEFRDGGDRRTCCGFALATKPHAVCLVPERREELTTEGGLDVVGQHNALAPFIARLNDAGIRVSLFIAADPRQIEMAAKLRAPVIEIHTGAWCDAVVDGHTAKAEAEWQRIVAGAGAGALGRPRGPCRPRSRLRDRGDDRGPAAKSSNSTSATS